MALCFVLFLCCVAFQIAVYSAVVAGRLLAHWVACGGVFFKNKKGSAEGYFLLTENQDYAMCER